MHSILNKYTKGNNLEICVTCHSQIIIGLCFHLLIGLCVRKSKKAFIQLFWEFHPFFMVCVCHLVAIFMLNFSPCDQVQLQFNLSDDNLALSLISSYIWDFQDFFWICSLLNNHVFWYRCSKPDVSCAWRRNEAQAPKYIKQKRCKSIGLYKSV